MVVVVGWLLLSPMSHVTTFNLHPSVTLAARQCVLPAALHLELLRHVYRRLSPTGRRNDASSDWHRPPAHPPRFQRAP